jgi:hypothetical protein
MPVGTTVDPAVAPSAADPSPESGTPASLSADGLPTAETLKWPGTEPEAETPEETPDADTDPQPEGETPPADPEAAAEVHTVDLALPMRDGKEQGTIVLELPSQEVADTLRHQAKQAGRVPSLEAKLDQYSGEAQTLAYIRDHPEEGFGLLAQNYPKAAEQFLASAIQINPLLAAQQLQAMGFDVTMLKDEDVITAKSKVAQYELQDRLRTGQAQFAQHQTATSFATTAAGVVEDLTAQLGIPATHPRYNLFTTAAQQEFQKLYQQNPKAGC